MLKSYFTIAIRTLLKNKLFSGINILGLSIGISASLVIYLLVTYHFSFDRFEKDNDRIYRVVSNFSFSGEIYHNSGVTDPMTEAVRKEVPGLEAIVPFRTWSQDVKVSVPQAGKPQPVIFKKQKDFVFADSAYFNMVGYTWLYGSPKTSFAKPYNTVLTESYARLYFPSTQLSEAIGREIILNDTIRATITGIVKNINKHTDFKFQAFMAYTTLENSSLKPHNWQSWSSTNGAQQLFLKLAEGNSAAKVEKQIAAIYKKNEKKEPGDNSKTWHTLQSLNDVHFNANFGVYNAPTAHKPTLYGLLAVAAFLLILGCINFINLTTAYAAQRAKEIGIRKTMGSSKNQLVFQFLNETFLLTLTATVLSLLLTPLLLKVFAGFIPDGLHFSIADQPEIIPFLLCLVLVVSILAGFYPALFLSRFKPVLVLKNQAYSNTGKTRNTWLRKSLTVSQFAIAQVFIMGAILVGKQITYSLNKDLGFKKDAIIYMNTNYYDTVKSHKLVLADKLRAIPEIRMISFSTSPPSSYNTWSGTMKYMDGKKEVEADVQQKFGDSNYARLYNLKMIAGNNNDHSDTVKTFVINETYSRLLGFQNPQEAIGKQIEWDNSKKSTIAGVVADFHQKSLHEPIKPLIIGSWFGVENCVNIALQPQQPGSSSWKNTLSKIEKAWKEVYPDEDFEYTFFDQELAKFYESEQNISSLLKWATGLAIFISCLGLLGLVIYTTTQRTKEIGVRKVLGASVANIVGLISKEFILLVMLAFVIASPVAWLGMNKWLENFAFRTNISWWIFLSGGMIMILIALITLGFQTIKVAMANPVKSLRTE
jgi:predicted permease